MTVAVAGHSGTDITLSGATLTNDTLTFTSVQLGHGADGHCDQAAQDDDAASDAAVTLTHTVSGTGGVCRGQLYGRR